MGSGFAIGGKLTTLYTDSPLHSPTHHAMHAYYTTQQQQRPEFRGEPLQRLTMDLDTSGEGVLVPVRNNHPTPKPNFDSLPPSLTHTPHLTILVFIILLLSDLIRLRARSRPPEDLPATRCRPTLPHILVCRGLLNTNLKLYMNKRYQLLYRRFQIFI